MLLSPPQSCPPLAAWWDQSAISVWAVNEVADGGGGGGEEWWLGASTIVEEERGGEGSALRIWILYAHLSISYSLFLYQYISLSLQQIKYRAEKDLTIRKFSFSLFLFFLPLFLFLSLFPSLSPSILLTSLSPSFSPYLSPYFPSSLSPSPFSI